VLASNRQPREFKVSHGGEARSYAGRRRDTAGGAARYGGGGPQDHPPPEKPGAGGFGKTFPYPPYFEERRLDPYVMQTPPLVGTPVIDMLPQAVCLGLS
jgi:hypothetical protein